jgi:ribose 5-phosphate isomerase B
VHVAVGADEDTPLLEVIAAHLTAAGHEVHRLEPGDEWPEVGRTVGGLVAKGEAEFGVVCCWTGTGVSMAANKVPGVRAALCCDAPTAAGARKWNDANVLALSLRTTTAALADEILDAWLSASPTAEELEVISRLE